MSNKNEPLQPTPFEPAQAQHRDTAHTASTAQKSAFWLPATVVLLAIAALLVFFWLPDNLPRPQQSAEDGTDVIGEADRRNRAASEAATTGNAAEQQPTNAPWADAQQARLRLQAQDILAELIDLQFALEEQGVQAWAPGAFADAAALATKGDVFYRQQEYVQASQQYQQSLQLLQQTAESIPKRVATLMQDAAKALETADLDLARESISLLEAIEPANSALPELQRRVAVLPDVITALGKARKQEQNGELTAAATELRLAVELDPMHRGASQALDRVNTKILESDFQRAMSSGYGKLTSGQYDAAIAAFETAATLKPGSAEAASAIREAESLDSAAQLVSLKASGARYESSEQWQKAVNAYSRALTIDSSVRFAKEGIERSKERLQVAQEFDSIMADQDRLSDPAIASQTRAFLRHSETIKPRGPILQSQIAALDELLQRYSTPVTVRLASDGQTDVVIYKVGKLGAFETRNMQLRPGTYTAIGSRLGYRDVRKSFRVSHANPQSTVTIICTESI